MATPPQSTTQQHVTNFDEFAKLTDYSLMAQLNADPDATPDGNDRAARQVFSGHFVPVVPTPLPDAEYVSHSKNLFNEFKLSHDLIHDERFCRFFSGDLSVASSHMRKFGWATGYALSIYGTEYQRQCPFGTGNGYGDGRAISVCEVVVGGKRWEMQLKGGGPTPYCRGADGRAVLRSSVREFLAQEFMHALGVPTSRSLTLFVSRSERVTRPWYSENSHSSAPDILVPNPAAIATRVAPSFLRVGQLELFARRARNNAHPKAWEELRMIVSHLIEREYKNEINRDTETADQIVELARLFRGRLVSLVAHWLRVGYCQGNFNSDNCAAGGYTLDYGPFGFCEKFDPEFQPWTGGGKHFCFFNQHMAAEANFHMFWMALRLLLGKQPEALDRLDCVRHEFAGVMQQHIEAMWSAKLGIGHYRSALVQELIELMIAAQVDYTLFFRELSKLPTDVSQLKRSFYGKTSEELDTRFQTWLANWRNCLAREGNLDAISRKMKATNPKYGWREWLIVPAYQKAMQGDYSLIKELEQVFADPYQEQTPEIENKYDQLRPQRYFKAGGVSHYSCSS